MTKPDDIDQDAWDTGVRMAGEYRSWLNAGNSAGHLSEHAVAAMADTIARAIMSAKAEERERAVHVVESHKVRCDLNTCHFASPSHECKYSDGFSEWRYDADIAAAIRNRH